MKAFLQFKGKLTPINNQIQTPFTIPSSDSLQIEAIINKGNIISGYASSLYFDLFGEVVLPPPSLSSKNKVLTYKFIF